MRKGIILAGGSGSRLHPITRSVCKQLLPVYDKPMIYYPLSLLMLADVRQILVITTPQDQWQFEALLQDGSPWGLEIDYAVQPAPEGLAQAFMIGEEFIAGDDSVLVLGDNIFVGDGLAAALRQADQKPRGATVFGYHVHDPERYGVVEFDQDKNVIDIQEKPTQPRSNYAVTGLYFYDQDVVEIARGLKPSARGEYEITDLNRAYLERGDLSVVELGEGFAWFDAGTHDSLLEAGQFVRSVQRHLNVSIACPEAIAFAQGWITSDQLRKLAEPLVKTDYGQRLMDLAGTARQHSKPASIKAVA